MWFFSKMNVPEGVNREAKNLLSRIPIRDLTFCDEFFAILGFFEKFDIFEKHDSKLPWPNILEMSGSKFGKNEVNVLIYGTNDAFYPNFRTFIPF